MSRRLHHFAQPFWKGRDRVARPYEFLSASDAEVGGAILARSADGVLVYRQWIDAEAGLFEDAETILIIGEVPVGALWIDDDPSGAWFAA